MLLAATLLLALAVDLLMAQQFPGLTIPYTQLGFSSKCLAAVNTTVKSCPGWLHTHTGIGYVHTVSPGESKQCWLKPYPSDVSFALLESWQLQELCDTSCRTELSTLRTSIKAACTAKQDLVVPGGAGAIAYPGE